MIGYHFYPPRYDPAFWAERLRIVWPWRRVEDWRNVARQAVEELRYLTGRPSKRRPA